MEKIRVYVDTSVFGGAYDEEFREPSIVFFEQIKNNQFLLVTSSVVDSEIELAPLEVKKLFEEMLEFAEITEVSKQALELRDAYLKSGVVTSKYSNDALHVALATVSKCLLIVSWNFKHIVHFKKIPLYNAVNVINGYQQIAIFSPLEVIQYDNENF